MRRRPLLARARGVLSPSRTTTGDVLALTTTLVLPGLGSVPTSTRFGDHRIEGVRLPFRLVESNEQLGRTINEVERAEIEVDVDDEQFVLRRDVRP